MIKPFPIHASRRLRTHFRRAMSGKLTFLSWMYDALLQLFNFKIELGPNRLLTPINPCARFAPSCRVTHVRSDISYRHTHQSVVYVVLFETTQTVDHGFGPTGFDLYCGKPMDLR
jgi:hypothetical protein